MPAGELVDMDGKFDRGLDSASDLMTLPPGCYGWSVNMLNRGGALQCRPGYQWKYTLPAGNLQGLSVFVPAIGSPVLVAFVDGVGYSASYPYNAFQRIQGAVMSTGAKQVFTAQCTQSATSNSDGSITLISPRQLLMVQDGINPPAYYDGRILTALTGAGVTPQGTVMAFVGARLWVARGNLVFASDIANPLSFLEQTYNTLGGVQYFTLPENCTGMAPIPGAPNVNTPLLVFTQSTTNMFQAAILNRTLWPSTANFQSQVFPTMGCVAGKSISAVSGMLWWFSDFGLTRLDSAQASALTTKVYRIDREMVRSSANLFEDLTGICSAIYENFVLVSVPSASKSNKHTWVYDGSVNDLASQNAAAYFTSAWSSVWASVWTGVQPVEWASLKINGRTRLFCASEDSDGQNRIYEAFTSERRDNGCDIPWAMESRAYIAGTPLKKHMRFIHYSLSELQGEVNLRVSWAGATRGRWKVISMPNFYAEEGNINATETLTSNSVLYGFKKQSRVARTRDVRDIKEDSLSSQGIEGLVEFIEPTKESVDIGYQVRIEGSGPCAVRQIAVFMDRITPPDSGQRDDLENPSEHYVRFDGAAAREESKLDAPVDVYPATANATASWNNFEGQGEAGINGTISQAESTKRANQVAHARAEEYLRVTAEPYAGGSLVESS